LKVPFSKSVDVESEVSIDVEDITNALTELLSDAGNKVASGYANDRSKAFAVGGFVSGVHQCLAAVTDEMIDCMGGSGRKVIADALRKQAARFYEE